MGRLETHRSRRWGVVLAAVLWACGAPEGTGAAEGDAGSIFAPPDFDLSVEASADSYLGEPGDLFELEARVVLESTPTDPEEVVGAQGWTLSLATTGGLRVVRATTEGTAGDVPPAGLLSNGFEITTLSEEGEAGGGAVSAVALSFFEPISIPVESQVEILRLTLEARIPAAGSGCEAARVEFRDGLRGEGVAEPLNNTITYRGQTRRDDGSLTDHDRDTAEGAVVLLCPRTVFLRGDCSPDRDVDLSDAILLLNYLFLGGREPACFAACDSNDDTNLDITDPIFTLNHLFLGGPPLPEPYPFCAEDPTPGQLPCQESSC